VGFLRNKKRSLSQKAAGNQYHGAQSIKYIILVFLLGAAAGDLIARPTVVLVDRYSPLGTFLALVLLVLLFFSLKRLFSKTGKLPWLTFHVAAIALFFGLFLGNNLVVASLQTGLLDPIPLITRSVNLIVLPILQGSVQWPAEGTRYAVGAWLIGAVFLTAVLLNLRVPRFYCRFLCPLGALFGILGRFSLWRVGASEGKCSNCLRCEAHCEGACTPSGEIRINECVLCMNCLNTCHDDLIGYRTSRSELGEVVSPDLSRRGVVLSLLSGVAAVPIIRLGGVIGANWQPRIIRPPGALSEADFLKRCLKCGQCMRICPTNIIHPAGFQGGLEGLWTPELNFRVGTSGCQYNCVMCGHVCPTAAIRSVTLDEKKGKNDFSADGPIRLGTAFVDRGRCLPWAMDKPCIVCQENCPVSPKAIFTRKQYITLRDGRFLVRKVSGVNVELDGTKLIPGAVATGDFFCLATENMNNLRGQILKNTENSIVLAQGHPWSEMFRPGTPLEIQILLKRPFVSPDKCTGCGICEHECPVSGKRAIRVTAENESRSKEHALLI
jgi:ferredoxin